ncbi:MAG: hypothetical protein K9H16_00645 [Bacteroidales bacterium]|nr:hypothetical protein [Bacteroidales bacterium]
MLNTHFVNINITNGLRGLSVVNEKVAWASGTNGVFLKTEDGGETWLIDSIAGAENLDFRSIEAFNQNSAIVVSAGTPANIYLTQDGGTSWELTWSDSNPAIFLDAVSFWSRKEGLVMGDPVDGYMIILKTFDGGKSWHRMAADNIPQSLKTEGGFAASGTCLALAGETHAWIGTGGDSARVYTSQNGGFSWSVTNTPILSGSPMKGIYSLAFKNEANGIAVGGEWNVKNPKRSKAFTVDGGKTWVLAVGADNYCSGSCYVREAVFLACGQSGIDLSVNGGKTWDHISDIHLYGIEFDKSGMTGFGTGPSGRLVKLSLVKK